MKKLRMLMAILLLAGLLSGCTGKFNPDETAVKIGKDGSITAAIIDKLDQSYYKEDELETTVTQAVADYNKEHGEDAVTVKSYEAEERNVSLFMNYAAAKDYAAFNKVIFFPYLSAKFPMNGAKKPTIYAPMLKYMTLLLSTPNASMM